MGSSCCQLSPRLVFSCLSWNWVGSVSSKFLKLIQDRSVSHTSWCNLTNRVTQFLLFVFVFVFSWAWSPSTLFSSGMQDHLLQSTWGMASTGADFGTRGPRLMVLLQKVKVIPPLRDQTSLEKVSHCGWAIKFYSLVHFLFTICFLGMGAQRPASSCFCQHIFPTVLVTFPVAIAKYMPNATHWRRPYFGSKSFIILGRSQQKDHEEVGVHNQESVSDES